MNILYHDLKTFSYITWYEKSDSLSLIKAETFNINLLVEKKIVH